jgi:DHA2 family multidrug resistance protein
MALSGFEMAELRYASGLFNLMRNLGGAIGIAVVNTWLQDDARIMASRMGESLGEAGRSAPNFLTGMAARIGSAAGDANQAMLAAQGQLARVVGRDALTLGFDEVFRTMAWIFIIALVMVPICKPPPLAGAAPPPDAH